MTHRIGRLIFGFAAGLLAAFMAYQWVANSGMRAEQAEVARLERIVQESVVVNSRELLAITLQLGELELVDPLSPDRVVGKTYVYPLGLGWEVSGFYRRDAQDLWHPYLISLDSSMNLAHLKISDTALLGRNGHGELEVLP